MPEWQDLVGLLNELATRIDVLAQTQVDNDATARNAIKATKLINVEIEHAEDIEDAVDIKAREMREYPPTSKKGSVSPPTKTTGPKSEPKVETPVVTYSIGGKVALPDGFTETVKLDL